MMTRLPRRASRENPLLLHDTKKDATKAKLPPPQKLPPFIIIMLLQSTRVPEKIVPISATVSHVICVVWVLGMLIAFMKTSCLFFSHSSLLFCFLITTVCDSSTERLMVCSSCGLAFHLDCVRPVATEYPTEPDWRCAYCWLATEPKNSRKRRESACVAALRANSLQSR